MKNYLAISSIFCLGVLLFSCTSSEDKVQQAEENVVDANQKLEDASLDYKVEMKMYKQENLAKIEANEAIIRDFNTRIASQKKEAKEDYQVKIATLEAKNTDLKKKLDGYNLEGKDSWDKFKSDFNKELNDLALSVQELTKKND